MEPERKSAVRGIGRKEVSSLRPSSARYSFPKQPRESDFPSFASEGPGPASYVSDYPSALSQAAAVVGTAARRTEMSRPCMSAQAEAATEEQSDFSRFPSAPCAVFGTEERSPLVQCPDLLRVSPECRLGRSGPGFLYSPDERRARPSSAPCYSMPREERATRSFARPQRETESRVSPQFYSVDERALGVQRDSRRRTRPASSFGRSQRFPKAKQAEGESTSECKSLETFGGRRRAPSATFGSSTREGTSRTRHVKVKGDGVDVAPARISHPEVVPRPEILRYEHKKM